MLADEWYSKVPKDLSDLSRRREIRDVTPPKGVTVLGDKEKEYTHSFPQCSLASHCHMQLLHPKSGAIGDPNVDTERIYWDPITMTRMSCALEGIPYPSGFAGTSTRDVNIEKWFT
ncbi:MAG: hypothetical protein WBF33_08545 [Candidatus Nitrosopolaris sp.]|jgi:hypothetical protein